MAGIRVDIDNFIRAETNRMLAGIVAQSGGVNHLGHFRVPTPLDKQTVIRMNRDTLYSFAVVDLSAGATLTLPETNGRYLSVMVVNQDHYINHVFHSAGVHQLSMEQFDTQYVLVAARTLADPNDPADIAAANAVQDGISIDAASAEPFVLPDYDKTSFDQVRARPAGAGSDHGRYLQGVRAQGPGRPGPSSRGHRGRLGRPAGR